MIVTFNGNSIVATPVSQEEIDVFLWLSSRVDSEPLIKFHLEALINQRIDQMNDETKELLFAELKKTPKVGP